MNIFSTITAVNAIILFGLDFIFITDPNYGCFDDYNCHRNNALLMSRTQGIAGVMIVLSLLEFIVSICVSAFACNATCCSDTEQVVYSSRQVPPYFPTSHLPAPPQGTQMTFFPTSVGPPLQNCSADGRWQKWQI
ncbi:membrane-spanning 4-domains subfamily A member 4A-like [Clupea harengus]|uniref:Membrane-spanning 4-domains subfamily A member 4A-like n=1 Tax=Clupea harengus TaxID=7950 RepID=A0A6P8G931_CLUHA|nr:membrane-spanning 4-domains subfamily A member 4A-like [Clupea harengus]